MVKRAKLVFEKDFHSDPNFVMNERQKKFYAKIDALAHTAGTYLLSSYYVDNITPFWFLCSNCGRPYYNRWANLSQGINKNFQCHFCWHDKSPDINQIRRIFVEKGALLITDSYINRTQKLYFLCSKCGRVHFISWSHFLNGRNSDLVCPLCMPSLSPTLNFIKSVFAEHDAVLLTTEYRNNKQKLYFRCKCGEIHYTTWAHFSQGFNPNLLCFRCLQLSQVNPIALTFGVRNTELGGIRWFGLGRLFFNVNAYKDGLASSGYSEPYSIHHIFNFDDFPLLQSSITNGFPVLTHKVHGLNCENYRIIHSKQWHNPESWNTDEFQNLHQDLYQQLILPYQRNIPNFQFYDLTKYFVTETIIPSIDLDEIHKHKQYWKNKGVIYIPVSYKTFAVKEDRIVFFNQIRDELRKFIPEIDQYTGVDFNFKEYLKMHSSEF